MVFCSISSATKSQGFCLTVNAWTGICAGQLLCPLLHLVTPETSSSRWWVAPRETPPLAIHKWRTSSNTLEEDGNSVNFCMMNCLLLPSFIIDAYLDEDSVEDGQTPSLKSIGKPLAKLQISLLRSLIFFCTSVSIGKIQFCDLKERCWLGTVESDGIKLEGFSELIIEMKWDNQQNGLFC